VREANNQALSGISAGDLAPFLFSHSQEGFVSVGFLWYLYHKMEDEPKVRIPRQGDRDSEDIPIRIPKLI
jgi:hypothetical protein